MDAHPTITQLLVELRDTSRVVDEEGEMTNAIEEEVNAMTKRIAELEAERNEERAIVDRIWDQLGSPSYEELNGRSIYDLIDALKADAERYRWLRDVAPISLRVRIVDVYDDCAMDRSIDAAKGE